MNVFSVGFGTEGASGNSGIDVDLLSSLSNTGPDGFFQVAENSTQLDKFFINALGGAIESELIVDPEGDIAPGGMVTVDAGFGTQDRAATFILTWDDPQAKLALYLRSPSGLFIHAGNAASFGDKVSLTSEPGYAFYKVKPPLPAGPSSDHGGVWEMIVHNTGARTTHYMANVLADSTINLSLATRPPFGASAFATGDAIDLNATFSQTGAAPFTNAQLTVYPSVPVAGLGDMFSSKLINKDDLAKVPTTIGDERLSLLERLGMAFQNKYGRPPVSKRSDTPFTLDLADQGKDTAYFTGAFPTKTPGEYCFLLRAQAHDDKCDPVQREILRMVRVKPVVSRKLTCVDIIPRPPHYKLVITPKDDLGHFVGPGHADAIEIKADGLDQSGPIVDNIDGSYCVEMTGSSGVVSICVSGVELPPIKIEGDVPVPTGVVPPAGTNDVRTPIVVTVGGGGATGLLLVGGELTVELPNVNVDPNTGNLHAIVPAGLVPGSYRIQVIQDNKVSPPSEAVFKVIGKDVQFPDVVAAFGTSLDALLATTDNKEGLVILGDLLLKLRNIQPGGAFTEKEQAQAAEEISKLLMQDKGVVDKVEISPLLDAFELVRIDARDGSYGAVNTLPGTQVEVKVSHNVKMMFNRVVKEGESKVELLQGPLGFRMGPLGRVPAVFDITSTADFGDEGIMIEVEYEEGDYGNESALILAHRKGNLWTDITTNIDPETNKIQGFTESLSEFAIMEILPDQEVGEIDGEANDTAGIDITTPDGRFYDIQFSIDMKNWVTIASGISGTYTDIDPTRVNGERQFYQAVLRQP